MIVNKKTIAKLSRLVDIYRKRIFTPLESPALEGTVTFEHLRTCPGDKADWTSVTTGLTWGEAWQTMWLRGCFTVPGNFKGDKFYIQADTGAVEVLLMVDGEFRGILNIESEEGVRGHHHTRLALTNPKPGSVHTIAMECYAGHPCPGTQPFDPREARADLPETYRRIFRSVNTAIKNDNTSSFVTELRLLLQIAEQESGGSFRGARIYKDLVQVFRLVPQQPSDYPSEEIDSLLVKAREIMKPLLAMKNGGSAPTAGIIGHSHMDTAWLWTIDETVRKCARTFSNSLNLMEEYPDYLFLQSAPYHLQMMKDEYPSVFEGIKARVKEGRWEPNGGSWVEPDCNIPCGEAMTRHFLYGQMFLDREFGYRADTFWQPDVFGYSASIPQILKQCGISNFLTTKLSWNEENRFPYDSFHWYGIDGSSVLTHFNTTHNWPDPESLITQTRDIQHKDIQTSRYCSFGYGDGGGGPLWEMLETAPYMKDIEGVPKTEYAFVSDFMKDLGREKNLPAWKGELYLELHRGTLTSFHNIKRYNRLLESALREGEYLDSLSAINGKGEYRAEEWERLWKVLLVNQFHDILPGTSIAPVNERAHRELRESLARVEDMIQTFGTAGSGPVRTFKVVNSRCWNRTGILTLSGINSSLRPADDNLIWQKAIDVNGDNLLLLDGPEIPSLGSLVLDLTKGDDAGDYVPFHSYKEGCVETTLFHLEFGERGEILSLLDKTSGREMIEPGCAAGLTMGEDLPAMWDNWDIDVDQHEKRALLASEGEWLLKQEGPLQIRLANRFTTEAGSVIDQHIILYKNKREIEFDTRIDWKETHKLLKADFPLDLQTDRARFEIQYGHLERETHDNLSTDRSRFEVSNHRWTDISEAGFGVALLNDSSYGISVRGTRAGLSLLKSGTHPDPSADRGTHSLRYALRPHSDGFSVPSVLRPAAEFNAPLTVLSAEPGTPAEAPLFEIGADNVLLESMKQAQDGDGYILRFYEGEKKKTLCPLTFKRIPVSVEICNMLEESEGDVLSLENGMARLSFGGLEIKSVRVKWK